MAMDVKLLYWNIAMIVLFIFPQTRRVYCHKFYNMTRVLNAGDVFSNYVNDIDCDPSGCGAYQALPSRLSPCHCQCPKWKPTFMQHIEQCVGSIHECKMIEFASMDPVHMTRIKIPTIILPGANEIVSEHLRPDWNFANVENETHACNITEMEHLTSIGWSTNETPLFSLLTINGLTSFQYLGSKLDSKKLSGKVLKLSIRCITVTNLCLVFRIVGKDVSQIPLSGTKGGGKDISATLRANQLGLVVGVVCGVLLGLTFIFVAIFWMVCWRQQKPGLARKLHLHMMYQQRLQEQNGNNTFGHFTEIFRQPLNDTQLMMNYNPYAEPIPWSNGKSNTEEQEYLSAERLMKTSALLGRNHSLKRKLYFNPDFLKPELMVNPPLAAHQFLTDIRQMMFYAKIRLKSKRYRPTLPKIPEERDKDSQIIDLHAYERSVSSMKELAAIAEEFSLADSDSISRRSSSPDNRSVESFSELPFPNEILFDVERQEERRTSSPTDRFMVKLPRTIVIQEDSGDYDECRQRSRSFNNYINEGSTKVDPPNTFNPIDKMVLSETRTAMKLQNLHMRNNLIENVKPVKKHSWPLASPPHRDYDTSLFHTHVLPYLVETYEMNPRQNRYPSVTNCSSYNSFGDSGFAENVFPPAQAETH